MLTIQETTARTSSEVNSVTDLIDALQNIVTHSRVVVPIADLETPYCRISNCAVTEVQDRSISAIITERQQELEVVLHEISGLDTVEDTCVAIIKDIRQQLMQKRDQTTTSMNLHKGLASALWRLPAEVLCQIFDHYLSGSYLSRTSEPNLLLLTRVCRRWRDVAMDNGRLWCRLAFHVCDNVEKWDQASFYYQSWLKRSQECPLSLQLHYSNRGRAKLRRLVQPYLNRVSSLEITGSDCHPERVLAKPPAALQELTMYLGSAFLEIPAITQYISKLPSTMHSLKMRERTFDLGHSMDSPKPVWAHVTHVEISVRLRSVHNFLQLCPNLSSCEITLDQPYLSYTYAGFYQFQEPFMHANLQSLCIICPKDIASDALPELFKTLRLPALSVLEIRHQNKKIASLLPEEFMAFLARSRCPLEMLILDHARVLPEEQRAKFIAIVPSLKIGYRVDNNIRFVTHFAK